MKTRNKRRSIRKMIFGYDIFISYSRKDSLDYAYAIAQYFMDKGYECYIDQLSSIMPGAELPLNIKKAVGRSSAFVLVGSKGAQRSVAIKDEIGCFLANNKNKPLIPITIGGAIDDHCIWVDNIRGLALVDDSVSNLENAAPAKDVLVRIENSLKFTKKSVRLRNTVFLILTGIVTISSLSAFYSYTKTREARNATIDKERASAARDAALNEKQLADKLRNEADLLRKEADVARGIALKDKGLAEHSADSARREAERSGIVARANYLINLSNNLSNKYFAFDTALKAIEMHRNEESENNLIRLFLDYPFVYSTEFHRLDVPNKLLSRKGGLIYYLDGSIRQHDITKIQHADIERQKLNGYPNIVKDSIIIVLGNNEITKNVVHAFSNTISVSRINFSPPVYLSGSNLFNGRIIHEQGNFARHIDSTIEITEYNGTSSHLVTVPLLLAKGDEVENRKIFYANGNYYLAIELVANDKDVNEKITRILVLTFDQDFHCLERNMISINKVLFPNYNFSEFDDIVRYTDPEGTFFLLFFNKKICRYSLTEDRERNGIEVSEDSYVEDKFFIPQKNVVIIKNGPHLIVEYLADLERTDPFSMESYAITLPEGDYSFLVAGQHILILTRAGHFYVLDININPNVPNDYLPVDEILSIRTKSRNAFLKYIGSE